MMSGPTNSRDSIQNIGLLGVGQMGIAAAVMFRRAGVCVRLWTRREPALNAVRPTLEALEGFLNEHIGPPENASGELTLESDLLEVDRRSDAILECVVEDMAQKAELLRQLQSCLQRRALVMSCTSALSITEMGRLSGLEPVLVGAHFWNPPHLIPVVEVIAGANTPPEQAERAMGLLQRAGKVPVRCADVPGFVGNRLMHAMWREALALLDAGVASAEDIDRVVKWTFALRLPALGPLENMDLVGLGLVESVQRYLLPHLATNAIPADSLTARLRRGETCMKAGKGFYRWSSGEAADLVALRDRQIIRQLQFLREQGAFGEVNDAPLQNQTPLPPETSNEGRRS